MSVGGAFTWFKSDLKGVDLENLNGQKGNQELVIKSFLEQLADGVALIAIKYIGYWSGNLYDFKVSEDAADLALSGDNLTSPIK